MTPPTLVFLHDQDGGEDVKIFQALLWQPLATLPTNHQRCFLVPSAKFFSPPVHYLACQTQQTLGEDISLHFWKKRRKFAKKHMCCFPSRWHFFNLGDILTKKPVTPQDDKDCYKSLVSKNTKSCRHWVQIWSRTAKILFQISGPNQGSFAFAFRPLNISEAVWQRSENLKWKRPTLLYKATHVYTMQCNALEQQRKEPYDTMWPCIWQPYHTMSGPFSPQP